jgi:hypothetical protein
LKKHVSEAGSLLSRFKSLLSDTDSAPHLNPVLRHRIKSDRTGKEQSITNFYARLHFESSLDDLTARTVKISVSLNNCTENNARDLELRLSDRELSIHDLKKKG